MNSQQLSSQADALRTRAASSRREADRHTYKAEEYRKNGDEARAGVEDGLGQRLISEAEGYESEAEQLSQTSVGMDAQAIQLNSEKEKVKAEYESKIAEIEKQQARLTGGGL